MSDDHLPAYLLFVVFSILLGAFQYGYHNGELNTPQTVMTHCPDLGNDHDLIHGLPRCLPMSDERYSLVVSMLTAGGLLGALSASYFSDRFGRRLTLMSTNIFLGIGSMLMTIATSSTILMVGRLLAGIGSGIVTVVVPAYVAECVPKRQRGFFGTLNQLSIVVGIFVAQVLGLAWSTPEQWRAILAVGCVLAALQLCLLPFCVESPRFLALQPHGLTRAARALLRLRGEDQMDQAQAEVDEWCRDAEARRSGQSDSSMSGSNSDRRVHILQFLTLSRYRRPLFILCLIQLTQQLSGINAVIFYSTSIMSTVFPESSSRITVFISIVNLVITTLSAYLMDRTGRRTLFLVSALTMAATSMLLGWSIAFNHNGTAAVAIVTFVAAFAIGLGPIPFLMIPELVETRAVSSAGSISLAINMCTNFAVSTGFMSLRNTIGSGKVFGLFGLFLILCSAIAYKILPETKGRSADEVVRSNWAIHGPAITLMYQPLHRGEDEAEENRAYDRDA